MAFFRKWKTHYKHKKFTSDDGVDGEDWGLSAGAPGGGGKVKAPTVSDKDVAKTDDKKLDIECGIEADDEEDNRPIFETYDIKYLGCTPIDTKRSEKVTSEAIKTVIANSKAGGRKNKSQKRVKVIVSNDGIEVLDYYSQDRLMCFSIYKISYCSVDASHDHVFSFVGSEKDPLSDKEKLSCHVFLCPKRKVAHEITLMVARSFEEAYQHWRDTVVQHAKSQSMQNGSDASSDTWQQNVLKEKNTPNHFESRVEVHQQSQQQQTEEEPKSDINRPLIDLAASDNDVRKFLQNTWVSFEEDSTVKAY